MDSRPLIVAALKDEIRIFLSKMSLDSSLHLRPALLRRGKFETTEVDCLMTGMGEKKMGVGLEKALSHLNPSYLLLVGYCGGTSPVSGLGSLILAREVLHQKSNQLFLGQEELLKKAKKICEEDRLSFQEGRLTTVDHVVGSPHEKADIGAMTSSLALDMEASALTAIAQKREIPFLVVKAVLDPMEMALPDLQDCISESGESEPMKVMEHLMQQPSDCLKLPQLQYAAFQARHAVTKFLEGWFRSSSQSG